LVNPVIVWVSEVDPALASIPPAGTDVTIYPVIAEPPLLTGDTKVIVAPAFPAVAATEIGAFGTPAFTA